MKNFKLKRFSKLSQPDIFQISTDVKNFHNVMPNYFKSLKIIQENKYGKLVDEKINFSGASIQIKTKHIIIYPDIHEVHILTGPLKGTSFIESYVSSDGGTSVSIDVHLQFSGIFKLLSFLGGFIGKKMAKTMDEFIQSAERYSEKQILIK